MHRVVAFFAALTAIALINEPIFGAEMRRKPTTPNVSSHRRVGKTMNVSNMHKWRKVPPKANSHESSRLRGQNTKVLQSMNVLPKQIREPHHDTFSSKTPTVNRNDFEDHMKHVSTLNALKSTTTGKRDELVATSKRGLEGSAATNSSSQPHNVTALSTVSRKLTTTVTSFKSSIAATLSAPGQILQKTATKFAKRSTEGMKRKTTNALKTTETAIESKEGPSKYSKKTKEKAAASETHTPKSVSTVAASNASTLPLISLSTIKGFEISTSPLRLSHKPSTIGINIIRENITSSSKRTTVFKKTSPRLTTKVGLDREHELALSQTNTTSKAELTPPQTNTTAKSIVQTTHIGSKIPQRLPTKIKEIPQKPQWILLPQTKSTSRGIKAKKTSILTTTTTTTQAIIRTTTSTAVTSTTIVNTTITTTSVGTTTSATGTSPSTSISISTSISGSTSITTTKATAVTRRTKQPVLPPTKKPKKSKIAKIPSLESPEETKRGDPDKSGGKGALIAGIVIGMVIIVAVVFASLFITFQIKRRQAEHQQQQQQGQPAATDGNSDYGTINSILNDPKSNMMESEWAPDKIKASQFTYKGPLQIPFKQPLILKHELEDEKPASQHESQHVQFDDALNEVHEMGSEVEVIVFGGRQKKATKTGKASTRYKHVPARVDTKEKQAQIAIREP